MAPEEPGFQPTATPPTPYKRTPRDRQQNKVLGLSFPKRPHTDLRAFTYAIARDTHR